MSAIRNFSISLFIGLLVSTGASAQFRCDAPSTSLDRRACEAARQGPDVLRRFIQRVQLIESLHFHDYVDEATRTAWERDETRGRALSQAGSRPRSVVSR
jgi:hypothetical protein